MHPRLVYPTSSLASPCSCPVGISNTICHKWDLSPSSPTHHALHPSTEVPSTSQETAPPSSQMLKPSLLLSFPDQPHQRVLSGSPSTGLRHLSLLSMFTALSAPATIISHLDSNNSHYGQCYCPPKVKHRITIRPSNPLLRYKHLTPDRHSKPPRFWPEFHYMARSRLNQGPPSSPRGAEGSTSPPHPTSFSFPPSSCSPHCPFEQGPTYESITSFAGTL